jgi:hypothetical protein
MEGRRKWAFRVYTYIHIFSIKNILATINVWGIILNEELKTIWTEDPLSYFRTL